MSFQSAPGKKPWSWYLGDLKAHNCTPRSLGGSSRDFPSLPSSQTHLSHVSQSRPY
jgi:hypothetical protein